MKTRILILAADAGLRATLARWLMAVGYGVELAEGTKRAREVAATETLALAIVAPEGLGEAGLDFAGELRDIAGGLILVVDPANGSQGPVEADGCITKPLSEEEVLLRVKAALPSPATEDAPAPTVLRFDGYTLDLGRRTCTAMDGNAVPLTRAEFRLLRELASRPGSVLSRDQLRQAVAGREAEPDDRSVDVLISRLRRKIEPDPKEPRIIVTVAGQGYRFSSTPQMSAPTATQEESNTGANAAPPAVVVPARVAADEVAPTSPMGRALGAPGRVWLASAGLALAALACLAALIWYPESVTRTSAPARTFDAAMVPLVTDQVRRDLAMYPAQLDHKAVAISEEGWAMAVAAADPESAKKEALERCAAHAGTDKFCRVYASGMEVVWQPVGLPLAADIHPDPLDIRLNAGELPSAFQQGRAFIEEYLKLPDHRAFAIRAMPATAGVLQRYSGFNFSSRAEVARIMVERCGYFYQAPCLLLSVDGLLTVQIPKSRRIEDLFLLTTETQMSEQDRQRIADVYRQHDWRALARGKSGSWYAVAQAPSEAAAVEAALKSCAQADSSCRLHAISNFRVADE
jgi:DNA-binding response OmpR family regulator